MKFFYLLLSLFLSLKLNSMLSVTSSSLLHSQHDLEGAGPAERRPPKLPPSQRADCLATTNQPNIFGRAPQPIERVRAGFSAVFLLVAEWKNNVFLSTLHFSASGEADDARSRFGEIILALMGLKDTWLITVM